MIVFCAILGYVFLNDPFGKVEVISMIVCFIGVIFIMKPSHYCFGLFDDYYKDVVEGTEVDYVKYFIFLGFPFCISVAAVSCRYIMRYMPFDIVVYYYANIATMLCAIYIFTVNEVSDFDNVTFPDLYECVNILVSGLILMSNILTFTKACQLTSATKVGIL